MLFVVVTTREPTPLIPFIFNWPSEEDPTIEIPSPTDSGISVLPYPVVPRNVPFISEVTPSENVNITPVVIPWIEITYLPYVPVAPVAPVVPVAPVAPVRPIGPVGPSGPNILIDEIELLYMV